MVCFFKKRYVMIGEGERICVLDSGFTKTSLFHSQYEVETLSFTDQSSSRNDLLNHGTASVSVCHSSFIFLPFFML